MNIKIHSYYIMWRGECINVYIVNNTAPSRKTIIAYSKIPIITECSNITSPRSIVLYTLLRK